MNNFWLNALLGAIGGAVGSSIVMLIDWKKNKKYHKM
jgi:hypothetical protein